MRITGVVVSFEVERDIRQDFLFFFSDLEVS